MQTNVRETSRDSLLIHQMTGKSAQQRNRILAFIKARGGDWSIGELAQALTLQKSTVSARINELLNDTKELVEASRRKDRISGITIRPVAIPPIQKALFS
jgi:predicted ArsR family transcriptional regulator